MAITIRSTEYRNSSSSFSGVEANDCVVRAFSLALNRPYSEIHASCKSHGRVDKKGTSGFTVEAVAKEYGMESIKADWSIRGALTLSQFIAANPTGKFYMNRRGHAFALIDGVIHDWARGTGPRTRIIAAFKVA
jgi:hypothetical protein